MMGQLSRCESVSVLRPSTAAMTIKGEKNNQTRPVSPRAVPLMVKISIVRSKVIASNGNSAVLRLRHQIQTVLSQSIARTIPVHMIQSQICIHTQNQYG